MLEGWWVYSSANIYIYIYGLLYIADPLFPRAVLACECVCVCIQLLVIYSCSTSASDLQWHMFPETSWKNASRYTLPGREALTMLVQRLSLTRRASILHQLAAKPLHPSILLSSPSPNTYPSQCPSPGLPSPTTSSQTQSTAL